MEVAQVGDQYLLRDSKYPDRPPHILTKTQWSQFVDAIKADEFSH